MPLNIEPMILTRTPDGVRVDAAPPRIGISYELMEQARQGELEAVQVDQSPVGELVKISAVNGEWIYRILELDQPSLLYLAEWPD